MTVTEADVETVRRFYAAFAARDFDTVRACFAPDAVWHLPGRNVIAGDHVGWDAIYDDFLGRIGPLSGETLSAGLVDVAVGTDHLVAVQHATAALMRVDPRGDRETCHCGHPLRRTARALGRTLVTRDSRGQLVPNVPLAAGAVGGALLATAWYPPSYRANHEAMRVAGMTIVGQAGANVFREFTPELKRMIPFRKRAPQQVAKSSPPPAER